MKPVRIEENNIFLSHFALHTIPVYKKDAEDVFNVNQVETKRRNVNVRHKLWNSIAEKLNRLSKNGAEKDADGWKRCFKSWRLSEGPDYRMKMQELIKTVPTDGNYLINVSDDEGERDEIITNNTITVNPLEQQKEVLHQLILKHKALLLSTADDEPLKVRLWQKIAEQLNQISGALTLTPLEWKESVDLEKYRTKRGRKPKKKPAEIPESNDTNSSNLNNDETTQASTSSQNLKTESPEQNNNLSTYLTSINEVARELNEMNDDDSLTESEFIEDDDNTTSEPENKRLRPSPLVKNFKFTNRMINAVEQLREDVQCINNTLKETADSLVCIQNVLERQCEQQDEHNALLKRSTQLLKVLVEFKIGKRTSINKKNFRIEHEA